MPEYRPTDDRGARASRSWWRKTSLALVALLLVVVTPGQESAQAQHSTGQGAEASAESGRYIQVNGFRFDPVVDTPTIPPTLRFGRVDPEETRYYIVQMTDRISPLMRTDLEA